MEDFLRRRPADRGHLETLRSAYESFHLGLKAWAAQRAKVPPIASPSPQSRNGFPGIPGFNIIEELGRGGMGVVYHAEELATRREVARTNT